MHKNQYFLTLQLKQCQVAFHIQLYTMIINTLFFAAETNSSCAVGFLNQVSLRQIVNAPRDNRVYGLLTFSEDAADSASYITCQARRICIPGEVSYCSQI